MTYFENSKSFSAPLPRFHLRICFSNLASAGGYLYIHGGPYDATEELQSRFGDVFPDDEIQAVIGDLESDGIQEWAPIHTEPDYDAEFEFEVTRFGVGGTEDGSAMLTIPGMIGVTLVTNVRRK